MGGTLKHASRGGNYQTLINLALREHVGLAGEPMDERIRKVVREEVARYGLPSDPPGGEE